MQDFSLAQADSYQPQKRSPVDCPLISRIHTAHFAGRTSDSNTRSSIVASQTHVPSSPPFWISVRETSSVQQLWQRCNVSLVWQTAGGRSLQGLSSAQTGDMRDESSIRDGTSSQLALRCLALGWCLLRSHCFPTDRAFRGNELIISIAPPCAGKTDWFRNNVVHDKAEDWYPPPATPVLEVAIDKSHKIYKEAGLQDAVSMAAAACLNSVRLCQESIYDLDSISGDNCEAERLSDVLEDLVYLESIEKQRVISGGHLFAKDGLASVMGGEQAIVVLCLMGRLEVAEASYLLRREVMRKGMEIANPLPRRVSPGRRKTVGLEVITIADAAVEGLEKGFTLLAQRSDDNHQAAPPTQERRKILIDAPSVHVYQTVALASAIGEAIDTLEEALMTYDGPVAWGNTNTRVRDFQVALEAAAKYERPARFVVWGRELPSVGLDVLMMRNLSRLASEGKYIPIGRIHSAKSRCERMLLQACRRDPQACSLDIVNPRRKKGTKLDLANSGNCNSSMKGSMTELDIGIARLAGFSMNRETRVIRHSVDREA